MHWTHEKGRWAEDKVRKAFESRGYALVQARLRTPFAEVDLVMRSRHECLMIEVKALGSLDFLENRISRRQKERLRHAREWLAGRVNGDVRLILACVEDSGKILLFNLLEEVLN